MKNIPLKESLESSNLLYIRAVMIGNKLWGYRIIHIDSSSPSGKFCVSGGTVEEVEPLVKKLKLEKCYVSSTEFLGK